MRFAHCCVALVTEQLLGVTIDDGLEDVPFAKVTDVKVKRNSRILSSRSAVGKPCATDLRDNAEKTGQRRISMSLNPGRSKLRIRALLSLPVTFQTANQPIAS